MPADLTLLHLQRTLAQTDDPDKVAAIEARIADREANPPEELPDDEPIVDDDIEEGWAAYTKDELVEELRNRDLPVSGNKDELVARLEEDDA